MADGSLIFDTKVDTKGMKSDLQSVGTVAKGVFTADVIEAFAAKAGQAIAGLASGMVEVGAAFETSMSQVAATMGITTEEIAAGSADFEKLSQAAKDMGASTKYTAAEAAEGLNILAMAGLTADEAIETLPSVLALAAAGAMDMGTAASYVTGAVKGFADSMDNADKYADIMAKGATMANTDVNALGAALSGASASANAYGQSVESTSVALLRLAEQNVTGTEAATAMNRAMADLYTPTANGAAALEELGVAAYDAQGNARDFNDVVDDLNVALSGYTTEQKLAYENTIFTTFGMKAFQKMTVSTTETVDKFKQGIAEASGSAMQQMETQIDNLEGKMAILNSATEAVGIEFYEIFEDTMKGAVVHATDAMTRFQKEMTSGKLSVSLDKLATAIGNFADSTIDLAEEGLPKLIDGLAFILDHADAIGSGVVGIATAVAAYKLAVEAAEIKTALLNGTMLANPAFAIAAAVIGLTTALVAYTEQTERANLTVNESVKETKELTEASKSLNQQIAANKQARDEEKASYEAEDAVLSQLASRFEELTSKEKLSADEQSELQNVVNQLNSAYPDLNIQLDENCKLIGDNTKEVLENIEAIKKQTRAKAAQADLEKIANEQYEAEKNLYDIEKKMAEAQDDATKARQRYNEELQAAFEITGDMAVAETMVRNNAESTERAYQELCEQYDETKKTLSDLDEEFETTTEFIEANGGAAEGAAKSNEALADSMSTVSDAASEMTEEMQDAYVDFTKAMDSALADELSAFQGIEDGSQATFANIKQSMEDQIEAMQNWSTNMQELANRGISQGILEQLATMGPEGAAYVSQFVQMTDEQLGQINDLYANKLSITAETQNIIDGSWLTAGTSAPLSFKDGVLSGGQYAQEAGDAIVQQSYEGLVGSAAWASMSEAARQNLINSIEGAKDATEKATELGELIPNKTLQSLEASDAWNQMPESIKHHLIMANSSAAEEATTSASQIAEAETTGLATAIQENSGQVTSAVQEMSTQTVQTMNDTFGTGNGSSTVTQKTGQEIDSGLQTGINSNQSAPIGAAQSMANSVSTSIKNELSQDKFQTLGTQIPAGLASGIRSGASEAINAAIDMAKQAYAAAKKELDVNSPSKKFEYLGEMCIAGYEAPFENYEGPQAFNDIVNASMNTVKANASGGSTSGGLVQNIYVNKEVSTASEMARAIRLESRYGLMRGVSVG